MGRNADGFLRDFASDEGADLVRIDPEAVSGLDAKLMLARRQPSSGDSNIEAFFAGLDQGLSVHSYPHALHLDRARDDDSKTKVGTDAGLRNSGEANLWRLAAGRAECARRIAVRSRGRAAVNGFGRGRGGEHCGGEKLS